jgi:hypothetical protein
VYLKRTLLQRQANHLCLPIEIGAANRFALRADVNRGNCSVADIVGSLRNEARRLRAPLNVNRSTRKADAAKRTLILLRGRLRSDLHHFVCLYAAKRAKCLSGQGNRQKQKGKDDHAHRRIPSFCRPMLRRRETE